MTLTRAISILARVHTRTVPYGIGADDLRSFEIIVGASADDPFMNPGTSRADYLEAWSVVRENAGLMPEAHPRDEIGHLRGVLHEIKEMTPNHYAREHEIIDAALSSTERTGQGET